MDLQLSYRQPIGHIFKAKQSLDF